MEETRGFDITPVQYSAVLAIENHPGIDQTALCNIIAIDRSTVAEVVTRLERKKLISAPLAPRTAAQNNCASRPRVTN